MNTQHTYRPMFRPVSSCTLPEGIRWDFTEAPGYVNRPDLPNSRHRYGVVALDRALTVDECSRFGMELI